MKVICAREYFSQYWSVQLVSIIKWIDICRQDMSTIMNIRFLSKLSSSCDFDLTGTNLHVSALPVNANSKFRSKQEVLLTRISRRKILYRTFINRNTIDHWRNRNHSLKSDLRSFNSEVHDILRYPTFLVLLHTRINRITWDHKSCVQSLRSSVSALT